MGVVFLFRKAREGTCSCSLERVPVFFRGGIPIKNSKGKNLFLFVGKSIVGAVFVLKTAMARSCSYTFGKSI